MIYSAGSDCRLVLKFWDGRTDTLCENNDHLIGHGLVGQLIGLSTYFITFFCCHLS